MTNIDTIPDPVTPIKEMNKALIDAADIDTNKTVLALFLGVGGETPEMTQLHQIEVANQNDHKLIFKELKIMKYALLALAGSIVGLNGIEQFLRIIGGG